MYEPSGEPAPARVPGAVLAWLAVIVLGLGGWWWTSNSPEPTLAPPGGQVLPLPMRQTPEAELPVAEPAADTSGLSDLLGGDDLAAVLLPRAEEAVLGRGVVLSPGGSLVYDGAAPTRDDYLFEAVCHGGGEVTIEITLPNLGPEARQLACDGRVSELVLSYRYGRATIRAWMPQDAPVTVLFAFQVSPL